MRQTPSVKVHYALSHAIHFLFAQFHPQLEAQDSETKQYILLYDCDLSDLPSTTISGDDVLIGH